ncbi:MAG: GMC family oxidoreductase N-terminal domain-containing protein [Myxococcota bacterium]|nr:GMC family oxidoreductase N-terminal domain-containing protein [Myxococcota bacterium]
MSSYDYIVVGAGSAGCATAARLAENPNVEVLLLEAGRSDMSAFCRQPGMVSVIHTVPQIKKKFDWGYYTEPQTHALNRKIPYTRGKCLGGSSAINGMLFVRGNRQNFDDWAADGCPGWDFESVLPAYKRLENYHGPQSDFRGTSGPVKISNHPSIGPVSEAFVQSVNAVCNVPFLEDYNAGKQEGSLSYQMSAIEGLRYSTSESYLRGQVLPPNLHVETHCLVQKVNIEGNKAKGITFSQQGIEKTVEARSEVILSAGVIGSAQILMLSGVGPEAELAKHNIKTIQNLPVGQNLHDHLFFPLTFLAPECRHRGTAFYFLGGMIQEWLNKGKTWFGRTVFESGAFIKTNPSEPIPNLQLHSLPWAYPAPNQDAPGPPNVDKRPALTVLPTMLYPKSRGTLTLRSNSPTDAPIIDPNFLAQPDDLETLVSGIKLTREIMNHAHIKDFIHGELEPGPSFFDENNLRKEIPNRVCTVYHPVGTCRMGSDERSVVDPFLKVNGIEGLRVADAAIMPSITGGNTNAPSILIGEKAAEFIRAGWA